MGYVARGGWGSLPLRPGHSRALDLRLPGHIQLAQEIQPPRPLRGREAALHELARCYTKGTKVVTVVGTGGIGKTALAGTFAERFGWRWPGGVLGVSFAASAVDDRAFRATLLQELLPTAAADRLESASPTEQEQALLEALSDWEGLLWRSEERRVGKECRDVWATCD